MRRSWGLCFGFFGGAVALAIACSSSDSTNAGFDRDGGPGNEGGIVIVVMPDGSKGDAKSTSEAGVLDENAACASYVANLCAKYDACSNGQYTRLHFGGIAQCEARETISCLGALDAPDNGATPKGTVNCGTELTASTCGDFFDRRNTPKACTPTPGPRDDGQPCTNDGQCQSTFCHAPDGAACGTCAEIPVVGASCLTNSDCGRAAACSDAGTCQLYVTAGGTCGAAAPCGFGLGCVTPKGAASGACVAEGTVVGFPCDVKLQKAALCEASYGLYCGTGDVCAQALYASPGGACGHVPVPTDAGAVDSGDDGSADDGGDEAGDDDGGDDDASVDAGNPNAPHVIAKCISGGECDPPGSVTGSCTAPAAEGAACDEENGPPCLKPAHCVGTSDGGTTVGVCRILATATCN